MIYILFLLLSILHTILFKNLDFGISVFIYNIALILVIYYSMKKNNMIKNKKYLLLIWPFLLLSLTYGLFSNEIFDGLNVFIIPSILIVMMIMVVHDNKFVTIKNYFFKLLLSPFSNITNGYRLMINNLSKKINIDGKTKENIIKYVKSFIVVIPIVVVVLMLLSSADKEFGSIFKLASGLVISEDFIFRVIGVSISFTYFVGFITYFTKIYNKKVEEIEENKKRKKLFDNLSINSVLVILNVIYLVFCYIQIKSLMLHKVGIEITYAEYAREGFFQLLVVSIINVVLIYIANKEKFKNKKYINIMSSVMIIFTYIILVSSFIRMYYYECAYGYTVLRFLVFVALFTEAILLIPMFIYVFNNKFNIIKLYVYSVFSIYVVINYLDVPYIVSRLNVDRYYKTSSIDVSYMYSLGGSGISALDEIYSNSNDSKLKSEIEEHFEYLYYRDDIREFNLSSYRAKKVIDKYNIKEKEK